jgi:hypothetical protein
MQPYSIRRLNLVENNKRNGVYLAVAASTNQLHYAYAFNESAKPFLPNGDVISMPPVKDIPHGDNREVLPNH